MKMKKVSKGYKSGGSKAVGSVSVKKSSGKSGKKCCKGMK